MRKSTVLFVLCISCIAGIAFHAFLSPDTKIFGPFIWYIAGLSVMVLGILVWAAEGYRAGGWRFYILFFAAAFFLGVFRYAQQIPPISPHSILYQLDRTISFRGVILTLPKVSERSVSYVVTVEAIRNQGNDWIEGNGKLLIRASRFPQYRYGDELLITCSPRALDQYEQYARKQGVVAACPFSEQLQVVAQNRGSPYQAFLYGIRERISNRVQSLFPDPYGGLLSGILYGDTSGVSSELQDAFRRTGIAHITALSGYNITVISKIVIGALVALWLTRKRALPVMVLLVFLFVLATGAEASVVRAAIMGILVALSQGFGRLAKMKVAIALAGTVMLMLNPFLLRLDLGFQLSFLSAIALISFSSEFATRTWLKHLPSFFGIREAGASSAAALIVTMPLLLYITGKVSPVSLFANIIVVPIVPLTMLVGSIAVLFDIIWHPLGLVSSWLARVLLGYIIAVAEWFGRVEVFHIALTAPAAAILFLAVVSGLWFWKTHPQQKLRVLPRLTPPSRPARMIAFARKKISERKKAYERAVAPRWRIYIHWGVVVSVLGTILAVQLLARHRPVGLQVYFFDIGQGDGFLIHTADGFDVLVDGGPTDTIVEKLGRTLPFWDQEIELVILTHPHADHVAGLISVLRRFKVDRVLTTGVLHTTNEYIEWLKEIKKQGIPMDIAKAGQVWTLGRDGQADLAMGRLEILYPLENFEGKRVKEGKIGEGGGLNDSSIVAKLIYGTTSFLLTGDATKQTEDELINIYGPTLKSDVLKVGHHGSKYSTTSEFLNAVQPKYAVIQVGAKNRYGHPTFSTLWRLTQQGVNVFRNDKDGDVVFESDGATVRRR